MEDRLIGSRLAWHARYAARRIGLPGVLGGAVLLMALIFSVVVVLPTANRSSLLKQDIAAFYAERNSPTHTAVKPTDPVQQLAGFYRVFPKSSQAVDALAKLHHVAAAHGVQLEQGTYRLIRDRVGKLQLYEMTLPVKGDYVQLRKFMSQALIEIPYLALDSVSFQRQKAGDAMLESQIKFTLYLSDAL